MFDSSLFIRENPRKSAAKKFSGWRILSSTAMPDDSNLDESKPLGYAAAFLYSLVIAAFWIPALVLRRTGRFLRELGADNWPRTNGLVIAGNVKVIHGWVVDYALGRLDYSYQVAGEYYAGSIARQYPDEQSAWNYVDARRNKPVVVRYKDDNAQSSALRDSDQDPSWSTEPSLFAMVWQHWGDELRGEPVTPDDQDL
ncbi:MAG: hypothetical protein ACLPHP_01355 [Candidatus Sulfotelmatobacter sp.]